MERRIDRRKYLYAKRAATSDCCRSRETTAAGCASEPESSVGIGRRGRGVVGKKKSRGSKHAGRRRQLRRGHSFSFGHRDNDEDGDVDAGTGADAKQRPSAGSRLGAMLRRNTPHLPSYGMHFRGRHSSSAAAASSQEDPAFLVDTAPSLELRDPPAAKKADASSSGKFSGRRPFYRSKSAVMDSAKDSPETGECRNGTSCTAFVTGSGQRRDRSAPPSNRTSSGVPALCRSQPPAAPGTISASRSQYEEAPKTASVEDDRASRVSDAKHDRRLSPPTAAGPPPPAAVTSGISAGVSRTPAEPTASGRGHARHDVDATNLDARAAGQSSSTLATPRVVEDMVPGRLLRTGFRTRRRDVEDGVDPGGGWGDGYVSAPDLSDPGREARSLLEDGPFSKADASVASLEKTLFGKSVSGLPLQQQQQQQQQEQQPPKPVAGDEKGGWASVDGEQSLTAAPSAESAATSVSLATSTAAMDRDASAADADAAGDDHLADVRSTSSTCSTSSAAAAPSAGAEIAADVETEVAAASPAMAQKRSRRKKLAELLHFRRRGNASKGSHANTHSPIATLRSAVSATAGPRDLVDGSGAVTRKGQVSTRASSDQAPAAAATALAGDPSLVSNGGVPGNRGAVSARRGSRGRAPTRASSATPPRTRRRDALLSGGKRRLRRDRSKLDRGSAGGSVPPDLRMVALADTSGEDSPSPGGSRGVPNVGSRDTTQRVGGAGIEGSEGGKTVAVDGVEASQEGYAARVTGGKPQLGTTYAQRSSTASVYNDMAAPWNTWGIGTASDFRLRTKGYGRSKVKAPSSPALYELASVDAYRSPEGRVCEVYPRFAPPAGLLQPDRCLAETATAGTDATSGTSGLQFTTEGKGQETRDTANTSTGDGSGAGGRTINSNAIGIAVSPLAPSKETRERTPSSAARDAAVASRLDGAAGETGHPDIPPVFVVNCQVPDVPTPFSAQGDGPTIHIIFVFRATPELRRHAARLSAMERKGESVPDGEALRPEDQRVALSAEEAPPSCAGRDGEGKGKDESGAGGQEDDGKGCSETDGDGAVPEAVRLLAEYVRRSAEDGSFRGRFKAIGDIINADEVGLPSIARRFSGKPILVYDRESSVVRGEGFVELDLNGHAFSYVGRKGLYITLDKWKTAIFRIGFLIEGRSDDEQPERMLGCAVLKGLDMDCLQELSLSPDGERLIVNTPSDGTVALNGDGLGRERRPAPVSPATTGSSAGASPDGSPAAVAAAAAAATGADSNHSAVGLVSTGVAEGHVSHSQGPSALDGHAESAGWRFEGSGSREPVVDEPHEKGLSKGARGCFGGDETMTLTAVASAAFAGGWFCALLVVVTMACWAELGRDDRPSEDARNPGGVVSAWLLRIFTDA